MAGGIRLIGAVALALTAHTSNAALVIDYPDFSSTAGLTLNGDAAQVGDVLRVAPALAGQAGSVFSTSAISLAGNASFTTRFQFRFSGASGSDGQGSGGHGLVFVIQTTPDAVGAAADGIGYGGLANSVGIEFDTWNSGAGEGSSSNHIGINVNGSVASLAVQPVSEADMNNGEIWNAWIDYLGAANSLEVRLSQSSARPAAPILSYTRNIPADLGAASGYVGFTSGTGGAWANHDVISWQVEGELSPVNAVPEPGTLASFALGLSGIAFSRRRSRARAVSGGIG
jgi:hypothetical protein